MADHITSETPPVSRTQPLDADKGAGRALVLLTGPQAGRTHEVGEVVLIGRAPECNLLVDALDVSRTHARIERQKDGRFVLRDLESKNGTFVNGHRVAEQFLELGDRISFGGATTLLFTQRDRLEERILHQQRMEAIGRLAGGIAHDFNNLLGAVLANASVLQRSRPETTLASPDVQEMLSDIRTAAQRACELTQQLLLFARRGPQEHRPVDLSKLVNDVARLCRRTFEANVTIETSIAPNHFVAGDAAQLHQVLMNLLINARDAMPQGGLIHVRLDTAPSSAALPGPTPWAQLTVSDTGVGMDEPTRQRVFEPFFTTKTTGQGTGLGLATVYGIITAHGGHVSVKSELGRGSIFEVLIPQREREQRPDVPTPAATTMNVGTEAEKPTVLVVDDEEFYLRSSARALEECGHPVLTAHSGAEALEIFRREHENIRLVLLDLMMPNMSGEETCKQLRRIDAGVKVLFVSGYRPNDPDAVALAGADGFLGKPFDLAALERATMEVLSK